MSVAVGNTTTRMVLWRPQAEEGIVVCTGETASLKSGEGEALRHLISTLHQHLKEDVGEDAVDVVIGGGSVPAVEVLLHDALSREGPPFAQVRLLHRSADQQHDAAEIDERSRARLVEELGLRVKPSPSWRVGKDRLCAALGALALDPHQSPAEDTAWVVVDSGTALTVNVVLPSPKAAWPEVGVFEGGLIMPGEGLMLRSLSSGTAQLPSLTYWPASIPPPLVGLSTEEAIRAGVRHLHVKGAVAVVKAVAADLERRRPPDGSERPLQVRVAVTGGGGAELVEALEADAREYRPLYDPLLVHRGLRAAWRLHADGSARRPRYDGGSGDNAL